MELTEKTISSKNLYDGKVVKLFRDEIELPNGEKAFREVVRHNGGATIYCELDDKILFVEQFRYPYGEVVLELPAGKLNKGEQPLETAKRELSEETGFVADKIDLLFEVYPSPGYTDERLYIYVANGLKKCDSHLDDDEFLNAKWIDKKIVKQMIEKGEIKDAKTLIALLRILK